MVAGDEKHATTPRFTIHVGFEVGDDGKLVAFLRGIGARRNRNDLVAINGTLGAGKGASMAPTGEHCTIPAGIVEGGYFDVISIYAIALMDDVDGIGIERAHGHFV